MSEIKLTTIDRQFLLNTFPLHQARPIKGEVLAAYYKAEALLKGWDQIKPRGCSCNYGALQREIDKLYKEWRT
jgi:hypothetical protein